MRYLLIFLMGFAVLFVISSCATTQPPLGEGELRLLKMRVPENGNLRVIGNYKFIFSFDSDGSAEIVRAVCTCADTGPRAYRPEDMRYGAKEGSFNLWLTACNVGSQRLECYVDYTSGGKRHRSNSLYGILYGTY